MVPPPLEPNGYSMVGGRSGFVVAGPGAGIGERLAGHGDEVPVVAPGTEREPQHAVGGRPDLAVGLRSAEGVGAGTPRPDGDLPDTEGRVGGAVGALRREALVDVLVAVEDEFGAVVVEGVPQRTDLEVVAVAGPGVEPGMVPDGHGAPGRAGSEIGPQPALLGAARLAATDRRAVAVEDDHVPGAEVVAVPPLPRRPGHRTEVAEVPGGVGGVVLVVAGCRPHVGP